MDGILVVDKPQGLTSHDVVDLIRKRFNLKKAGHAGTLDPMATGVLVVLMGNATKSTGSFLNDDKQYEATMTLGAATDTGDAWGRVTVTGDWKGIGAESLRSAFAGFVGAVEQTPPMYSAVKYKGKKLYELARRGRTVKMKPRRVTIRNLEVSSVSLPEVSFVVTCSKGTYIRQLASDIGDLLGCGAHLSRLRRMRSGRFSIKEAVTIDELKQLNRADVEKRLVSL
jgi:tRNA pseudouridine55 synthase